jgi:hypothetical protein
MSCFKILLKYQYYSCVRFDVPTVATLCGLVDIYRRFRRMCCSIFTVADKAECVKLVQALRRENRNMIQNIDTALLRIQAPPF